MICMYKEGEMKRGNEKKEKENLYRNKIEWWEGKRLKRLEYSKRWRWFYCMYIKEEEKDVLEDMRCKRNSGEGMYGMKC